MILSPLTVPDGTIVFCHLKDPSGIIHKCDFVITGEFVSELIMVIQRFV